MRFPLYGGIATIILGARLPRPGGVRCSTSTPTASAIPLLVIGVYVLSVVGVYFSVGLAACADLIFRGERGDGRRRARGGALALRRDLRLGGALDRDRLVIGAAGEPGRRARRDRRPPDRHGLVPGHLPRGPDHRDRGHRPVPDPEALRLDVQITLGRSRSPATSRSAAPSSCSASCPRCAADRGRRPGLALGLLRRRPAGRGRRPGRGVALLISKALSGIFGVALYRYALDGEALGGFTPRSSSRRCGPSAAPRPHRPGRPRRYGSRPSVRSSSA